MSHSYILTFLSHHQPGCTMFSNQPESNKLIINVKDILEHNHLRTSFQQEPGANGTEIINGIKYVRPGNEFVPNFQLFQKIEINGNTEAPLYTFLKVRTAPSVFYLSAVACYKHEDICV